VFFAPPSPDEGDGELIDRREAQDATLDAAQEEEPEQAPGEAARGELRTLSSAVFCSPSHRALLGHTWLETRSGVSRAALLASTKVVHLRCMYTLSHTRQQYGRSPAALVSTSVTAWVGMSINGRS
jgi:hypothetical protein